MHITSGHSPASGELFEISGSIVYQNDISYGISYESVIESDVPESSHTVEIEYIVNDKNELETFYDEKQIKIDVDHDYAKEIVTGAIKEITENAIETKNNSGKKEGKRLRDDSVDRNSDGLQDYTQQTDARYTSEDIDPELTNLTWLQNITNIMSISSFPITPVSPEPQIKLSPQNTRLQKFNRTIAKCEKDFTEHREEYKKDVLMRPQYSYSTLICMAMRHNDNKVTLSTIYSWIKDNFKYFKIADPTWKNSIRHNLSLNKIFVKVPRSKQEPGKGGFWKLDLTRLEEGTNQPQKKKKVAKQPEKQETLNPTFAEQPSPFSDLIPVMQTNPLQQNGNIGANVIIEPVEPPCIQVDDLNTIFLNSDWDDLQFDMLDSYLDNCFK